eukprot:jgi/Chrzof1/419/Cz01g15070.t1
MMQNYAGALSEFDAALQLDPADVVSASNKALCHLYMGQLTEAVSLLEAGLGMNPAAFLQVTGTTRRMRSKVSQGCTQL